jgi:hypothetical protein
VQIQYVSGYGTAAAVPQNIKSAILLKLTDLYEHRGDTAASEYATGDLLDKAIESLLWPDRVMSL